MTEVKENKNEKKIDGTNKVSSPQQTGKEEKKIENVSQETKKEVKKEEAVARGDSIHASKKICMYICEFIKNKSVDVAIKELEEVMKMKRAIPYRGEIPHRHDLGMMSGRYPIKVAGMFINILKGLKGNIAVNGLNLDRSRIYYASASWASRPARKGGTKFKRAHVVLKAKEIQVKDNKNKENKK